MPFVKPKLTALIAFAVLAAAGCSDDGDRGAMGPAGPQGPAGPVGPAGEAGGGLYVVADQTYTEANDLRGLTFAQVGENAGKLYAAGYTGLEPETRQVVVARMFADGTPDLAFGGDGFVELEATAAEGESDESAFSVAELSSGDVVVVAVASDDDGEGGQSAYLFRLAADGTPVAGWGDETGKVEVVFGNPNANNPAGTPINDTAWDVQVDPSVTEDRVVVFGMGAAPAGSGRTDNDRYVARLNITDTGAVADPTFNGGTAFSYNTATSLNDNGRRGVVLDDGRILSAGYTNLGDGYGNHIVLLGLTAEGALDETFGGFSSSADVVAATPGVAIANPFAVDGGFSESYAAGYQASTASFVTAGYGQATAADTESTLGYETSTAQDIVVFRVPEGAATDIDTGWANEGHLAIQSEGAGLRSAEDRGRHIVVLPDGRSVVAGRFGGNPAAVVLMENGELDSSVFGNGVIELPNLSVNAQFFGLAASANGDRVAMSTNSDEGGARILVLKVAVE